MKAFTAIVACLGAAIAVCAENASDLHVETDASSVVQLTDSNFEKLTQATTGSTTGAFTAGSGLHTAGPWFVKFYAPWCSHCRHMAPAWERLARELKGVVNVADLDATRSPNVAKRFGIKGYPTLILIDKGRMYVYKGGERTTERLAAFATSEYQKTISTVVPAPLTRLGMLVDFMITGVQEAQRIYDVAFRGFFIVSSFSLLFGLVIGMICCVILLSKSTTTTPVGKPTKISARKQD
ncbi:Thioredoxin family protein, putative [Babesia bigemina]|uniref:Thioredoxin family protein, putative n=1 Tax=Babesia bigemina TaxID=5866 RepID=A0A061D8J1_BABBI|nr:Thioredoxin family protein, putative [Babesia bigemina]CDR94065.1 Thioredoxin family protein, putative [Babesia bigemina]|eukprot:XP_012766251.1 Thioredoxin family protein, putative [Babesia bigemina]